MSDNERENQAIDSCIAIVRKHALRHTLIIAAVMTVLAHDAYASPGGTQNAADSISGPVVDAVVDSVAAAVGLGPDDDDGGDGDG